MYSGQVRQSFTNRLIVRPGSNEKKVELDCYKAFKEMLGIAFHDCKMKEVFL